MVIAASYLLLVTGALHSVLGEWVMFRRWRGLAIPDLGFPLLERGTPVPTVRACWHMLTVFAVAFAAILGRYAALPALGADDRYAIHAIALALVVGGVLLGAWTRGRHVGAILLVVAGSLSWLGA